jgi:hypothetical protein
MERQKIRVADDPATDLRLMSQEEVYELLQEWLFDSGCEAACPEGCWVEHDGYCEHGYASWFLVLGLI